MYANELRDEQVAAEVLAQVGAYSQRTRGAGSVPIRGLAKLTRRRPFCDNGIPCAAGGITAQNRGDAAAR